MSGGAAPLLGPWTHDCLVPGVQGEGEVEGHALVVQRLIEVQALGGQYGLTFIHCTHFCLLLN